MQYQDPNLVAVPGYAKRIKWKNVSQNIWKQYAETGTKTNYTYTFPEVFSTQVWKNRQYSPASTESQQRDADDQKCKMIKLCHWKQPCERDLKRQCGCWNQKQGQDEWS